MSRITTVKMVGLAGLIALGAWAQGSEQVAEAQRLDVICHGAPGAPDQVYRQTQGCAADLSQASGAMQITRPSLVTG